MSRPITQEQQDYLDMQVYVANEVKRGAAMPETAVKDWRVQFDNGTMARITTTHDLKISTNNNFVLTKLPHGNPRDGGWCASVKNIVADAVRDLSTKEAQSSGG